MPRQATNPKVHWIAAHSMGCGGLPGDTTVMPTRRGALNSLTETFPTLSEGADRRMRSDLIQRGGHIFRDPIAAGAEVASLMCCACSKPWTHEAMCSEADWRKRKGK